MSTRPKISEIRGMIHDVKMVSHGVYRIDIENPQGIFQSVIEGGTPLVRGIFFRFAYDEKAGPFGDQITILSVLKYLTGKQIIITYRAYNNESFINFRINSSLYNMGEIKYDQVQDKHNIAFNINDMRRAVLDNIDIFSNDKKPIDHKKPSDDSSPWEQRVNGAFKYFAEYGNVSSDPERLKTVDPGEHGLNVAIAYAVNIHNRKIEEVRTFGAIIREYFLGKRAEELKNNG